MPIQKVRLNSLKIVDEPHGKFGPQKKVSFKRYLDEGEQWISGWVNEKQFRAEEWEEGKEIELDIFQNGKYWNFKLPNKATKENAANEAARKGDHENVMKALREIYKKIEEIDVKVTQILNV